MDFSNNTIITAFIDKYNISINELLEVHQQLTIELKPKYTFEQLTSMKLYDIRKIASDIGIPSASQYKKKELIDIVLEKQMDVKIDVNHNENVKNVKGEKPIEDFEQPDNDEDYITYKISIEDVEQLDFNFTTEFDSNELRKLKMSTKSITYFYKKLIKIYFEKYQNYTYENTYFKKFTHNNWVIVFLEDEINDIFLNLNEYIIKQCYIYNKINNTDYLDAYIKFFESYMTLPKYNNGIIKELTMYSQKRIKTFSIRCKK